MTWINLCLCKRKKLFVPLNYFTDLNECFVFSWILVSFLFLPVPGFLIKLQYSLCFKVREYFKYLKTRKTGNITNNHERKRLICRGMNRK